MAEDVLPNKELPLAGVILCCTSILPELRTELSAIAAEMGAIHKFDLTSDVTHLIVGDTNTPKYKYVAKERTDVKVLRPEWVEAVRSSWLLGGDTNLDALEEEYKLPALAGLSICLTGFEDLNLRNGLQRTATANGAEFRRDLTKSVTHLIARTGDGQKYKFAVMWNINVVSLKWLEDSLERGMVLDESLYDPLLPTERQGVGAWNRTAPTVPEKRPRQQGTGLQRPRKLRRVASTKLGGQNEGLWSDIVGDASGGSRQEEIEKDPETTSAQTVANLRAAVQAEKSFASETTVSVRPRVASEERAPVVEHSAAQAPTGIFFGAIFFITGFSTDQTRILEKHLTSRDAEVVQSISDLSQGIISGQWVNAYILIPYSFSVPKIPSIDNLEIEAAIVTDMWIEKCLHNNAFVPPESHITSTPLSRYPIPGFHGMRICSTGFTGIDLLHLSKLVKLIGATYDEYLTQKASVLVCNTTEPNSEKLRHVLEWNIPAVMADWLWISVQAGEKKHFEPYLINKKQRLQPIPTLNPRVEAPGEALKGQDPPQDNRSSLHEHRLIDNPRREARDDNAWTDNQEDDKQPSNTLQEASTNSPSKPRSLSPAKHGSRPPPSKSDQARTLSTAADESSNRPTLNAALNELLKHKRESSKAPGAEDPTTRGPKKRRRLFGRANSHASAHSTGTSTGAGIQQKGFSRASSIDTMNEDGYGSVVDGLDSASTKGNSFASALTNNNSDKTEAQQLLESRLDMFRKQEGNGEIGFEEDDEPAMTQLGYEDPDAAAMREKFSSQTDKSKNDKAGAVSKKLPAVTKLKDHAVLDGWGSGRRTRRAEKSVPFWE